MADVAVMVGYEADVDQVRRIALDEARACNGVLAAPAPQVFFAPGVTPTHLQFTLVFSVAEFGQRGPVQSEVRLRIYRRMRAEGVPLPEPSPNMKILATD
jgi:small-conductance mechanosensitive channel